VPLTMLRFTIEQTEHAQRVHDPAKTEPHSARPQSTGWECPPRPTSAHRQAFTPHRAGWMQIRHRKATG
jgi:hypothetical protein